MGKPLNFPSGNFLTGYFCFPSSCIQKNKLIQLHFLQMIKQLNKQQTQDSSKSGDFTSIKKVT
jgi:hypothetical protein